MPRHTKSVNPLSDAITRVAREVAPTAQEIFIATEYADSIISRLKYKLTGDVEIITAGSVARGTQIRGSSDIDIFLRFPKDMDERTMEHKAVEIAKSIVDKKNESFVINYAEHPYVKIVEKRFGMSADIVPSFKIKDASEMGSAVDRTPLHNIFINSNLSRHQKDEVRAFKYLLKQHSIYGAEARISGFSGYLCELLVYSYGSLEKLLRSFSALSLPVLIKPLNRSIIESGKEVEGNQKFFGRRFLVIDPTDPKRNVAAAVSEESLARLVILSRALLSSSRPYSLFYPKRHTEIRLSAAIGKFERRYHIESFSVVVPTDHISEDTIWPQVRKLGGSLELALSKNISKPLIALHALHNNTAIITFFMNKMEVGARVVNGPSVFIRDGSERFCGKHKRSGLLFVSGDSVFSLENADFSSAEAVLKYVLKDPDFNFPSHILKSRAKVYRKLPEVYAKPVWMEMMRLSLDLL